LLNRKLAMEPAIEQRAAFAIGDRVAALRFR
jgi:hypothetical protein